MSSSPGRSLTTTFRYAAEARAYAGTIAGKPVETDACVLPADGQYTHRIWTGTTMRGSLEIGMATAETQGLRGTELNVFQTLVRIGLEKINLGDVLTIGRMSATLLSSYSIESKKSEFRLQGSTFRDVRVAGAPVDIAFNSLSESPITYDALAIGAGFHDTHSRYIADDRIATTFVDQVRGSFPGTVSGNRITVPGFGAFTLGELVVGPERCSLRLLHTELEGFFTGQVDFGILHVDNAQVEQLRDAGVPETAGALSPATDLDEEEELEVFEELAAWVNTHPAKDQPFLFFMGRSLTPVEFENELTGKTELGVFYLRFLSSQSRRFGERPRDAIRRAVDANRAE